MKSSKKIILLSIPIIILIVLFLIIKSFFVCNVSDKEAIILAKAFCNKMGITYSLEPLISYTSFDSPVINSRVKEVDFGEYLSEITIYINCRNEEVVYYDNKKIKESVRKKYKIPILITEPRNWPPFLSENKAKEIILSIANKISLPADVELSKLSLDKDYGYWIGYWERKHNGFPYDMDSIRIKIMAVDGEFYEYKKRYFGEPCPTEVKVTREEAIQEGWRQVTRLFKKVDWNKYKDAYEIGLVELKIVQPNVLFGKLTPIGSTKSRLAWVVVYGLKDRLDEHKMKEVDYMLSMTIKIDAATKKFLGGGINYADHD
jgi:hypothetical protein